MGQGVDVGDGLPMEHHADELGGAAAGVATLQRIGIASLAAVDHKPLHLVGDVGRDIRGDRAGAADRFAGLNQSSGLGPLGRRNEV